MDLQCFRKFSKERLVQKKLCNVFYFEVLKYDLKNIFDMI